MGNIQAYHEFERFDLGPPRSTELKPHDLNYQEFGGFNFSIGKPAIDLIVRRERLDRISFLHRND